MQNKIRSDRWASYAAAAAGVVGLDAAAQVQYVDFDPDLVVTGHRQQLRIDLNSDSIDDFVLVADDTLLAAGSLMYDIGRIIGGGYANTANDLLGSSPGAYDYVGRLSAGELVGPSRNFLNGGTFAFSIDGQNPFDEPWNGGVVDGYVGLRFVIGDSLHYGWMRIDVSADAKNVIIKDAAFNTLPDSSLLAGSLFLGAEESRLPEMRWSWNSVSVDARPGIASILEIYSSAGIQMARISSEGEPMDFSLDSLPRGLYVARLTDRDRMANYRQMVFIR